jgi:hypothetical protein
MYEYIRILLGARPILPISRLKVKSQRHVQLLQNFPGLNESYADSSTRTCNKITCNLSPIFVYVCTCFCVHNMFMHAPLCSSVCLFVCFSMYCISV